MIYRLLLLLLSVLPIPVFADISFIISNAEDAVTGAHEGSLSVGAIIIAVVGGLFVINLILKILRGSV